MSVIHTVGHSTRSFAEFLALLQSAEINVLVDVRRFPASRRYPQFNREDLRRSLADHGIASISLAARAVEQTVEIGKNATLATSTFTRVNGETGTVGDVVLAYKPGKEKGAEASGWDIMLARMTQQMAAFGAPGGEGELTIRSAQAQPLYDYFAA